MINSLGRLKQLLTNGQVVGLTIYGEARNQSIDGRVAVGNVIKNRFLSTENFGGRTYKDICFAVGQFSCWHEDNENTKELIKSADDVISIGRVMNPLVRECIYIGKGIVDNQFQDNVTGALYYRTVKLMEEKPILVMWKIEIGDHVFYRMI